MSRDSRTAGLAYWVLLGSLLVLVACGASTDADAGTPGFAEQDRTVDTSPFERAGPSGGTGSSTIPDAVLNPEEVPPTLPQPDVSITTTTLGELVDPEVAAVVDLCGFEAKVGPFENLPSATPAEVEPLISSLVALMGRYAEVAPKVLEDDLLALQETIVGLRELLRSVGFDASSPAYLERAELLAIEAESGSRDSFAARLTRVVRAEKRLCI